MIKSGRLASVAVSVLLALAPVEQARGQTAQPTLKESLTWLENTVASQAQIVRLLPQGDVVTNADTVHSLGNCRVLLVNSLSRMPQDGGDARNILDSTTVVLHEMSPAVHADHTFSMVTQDSNHVVIAVTTTGASSLRTRRITRGDRGASAERDSTNQIQIPFSSAEAADRVARALSVVISKCGGKPEPF